MPAAESDFGCNGMLVASWFVRGKLESCGKVEEKRARCESLDAW
jgi:hypothetical protein